MIATAAAKVFDEGSVLRRDLESLRNAIEHAAHLLPSQGPISAFVHHNTLHMFEDMPFHAAVAKAFSLFECQPYLSESAYRKCLERGRIRIDQLSDVLREDLGDSADQVVAGLCTRHQLRLAILEHSVWTAEDAELRWFLTESDALVNFRAGITKEERFRFVDETRQHFMRSYGSIAGPQRRDAIKSDPFLSEVFPDLDRHFDFHSLEAWSEETWQALSLHLLWDGCRRGARNCEPTEGASRPNPRIRDLLFHATGEDCDEAVNAFLIRFCAAFLDQGLAGVQLPHRDAGFFESFLETYRLPGGPTDYWLKRLPAELNRIKARNFTALECIEESLFYLGVSDEELESFLAANLLALRGWAGLIWQMETNAEWTAHPAPSGTLIGYLAVRLLLKRLSLEALAKESLGFQSPLRQLKSYLLERYPLAQRDSGQQQAFQLFQLAQLLCWTPPKLDSLSAAQWRTLIDEIQTFSDLERRRIFQISYERNYQNTILDAVAVASIQDRTSEGAPRFQAVFCIDDREESFRRHLEEVAPDCETYSAAGFYAIAMYYRGAGDAQFVPLCPNIIKPQRYVTESVLYTHRIAQVRRAETRRVVGRATLSWHVGSRSFLGGMFTALCGTFASVPLLTRVLFPRMTARIRRTFERMVHPPAATQLVLERHLEPPSAEPGHVGYTVPEMADIVQRILFDIGLTSNFGRLVMFFGHGSSSLNNPHESAYNCGACSGGRGGPNARAFAQMANDHRVRRLLSSRGLEIPEGTIFLGAYHNTCSDLVEWFDLDHLPVTHLQDFEHARGAIDQTRKRNAHERCRRFHAADLSIDPDFALQHVEARSEDLSQARPEYNHATNAVTIVGRRSRTRGLYLDRRAFLTSYDHTVDDANHTVLARILQAAIPVCAGISLEYYFSCVDSDGYGCGSKLPHNITSLLGVMSGAASDVRPGLSTQMIEIHEPLRQLFIIETTPDAMLQVMDQNKVIERLVKNDWVQLATLDPDSSRLHIFRKNRFEIYEPSKTDLPVVESSIEWYRGLRDNLTPALIGSA